MRSLFYCFVIQMFFTSFAIAAERIKMVETPESETAPQKIVDSLSDAANAEDLDSFLANFTNQRANFVKNDLEEIFSKHIIEMSVIGIKVVSQTENKIIFDFQYFWSQKTAPFKQKITSTVTIVKEGDWKISVSRIKNVERVARENQQAQQFQFGGGGQVDFQISDDELPSDIGRHNFGSCPGGKCNVGPQMNFNR